MVLYVHICFIILQIPFSNQNGFYNQIVHDRSRIEEILNSLENVLNYTDNNYRKLNADAILGITIAKAHLSKIPVKSLTISFLKKKADIILKKSKPKVLSEVDTSFKFLLEYLLTPEIWQKEVIFTRNQALKNQYTRIRNQNQNWETITNFSNDLLNKNRAEKQWNDCLFSLFNNYVFWRECKISEHCERNFLFNEDINAGYGILHRLLFIQISQFKECPRRNKWKNKIADLLCSVIFLEANQNSKYGFINILDDLFLEQILLCGQEGFTEFFNTEWMQYVLDIQKRNGCFSSNQEASNITVHREKRNSNQISTQCTDHTTGLGAAVLSLFLRYYLF